MAEPTLAQVFGANATQNSTTITISKTDLAAVGLTASSSNTAESLLTAILLQGQSYLTQTNYDANTDQNVIIASGYSSFTTRGTGNTAYRNDQLTVTLSKLDSSSAIDPDDY
jgi:hypothetical protein